MLYIKSQYKGESFNVEVYTIDYYSRIYAFACVDDGDYFKTRINAEGMPMHNEWAAAENYLVEHIDEQDNIIRVLETKNFTWQQTEDSQGNCYFNKIRTWNIKDRELQKWIV